MKLVLVKQGLDKLAQDLVSADNDLMKLAEETSDQSALEIVAQSLFCAGQLIAQASEEIERLSYKSTQLDLKTLQEMSIIAEEFDKSGDPILQKQSLVLDQILINMANSSENLSLKNAAAPLNHTENSKELYDLSKNMKKYFEAEKMAKAVKDQIKQYRPMEAALLTRSCPDHPGAQIQRLEDAKYQCSLDGKIYDFREGFTTMKGNKIPGGTVDEQTKTMYETVNRDISFSTREDMMKN